MPSPRHEQKQQRALRLQRDPRYDKRCHYRKRYQLSLEDFDRMLAAQDYRCLSCGADTPGGRGWNVHHSHKSGAVLAILCNNCNRGSGLLADDPVRLRRLAEINEEM
jgi:hypothetical protein